MSDIIRVHRDMDDWLWAMNVGLERYRVMRGLGAPGAYGADAMTLSPEERARMDILGASGELIFGRFRNIPWEGYYGKDYQDRPDLSWMGWDFEIRTRGRCDYELVVRGPDKDPPGRIMVLIVQMVWTKTLPTFETEYRIVGWLEADEARAASVNKELSPGRWADCVAHDKLRRFKG